MEGSVGSDGGTQRVGAVGGSAGSDGGTQRVRWRAAWGLTGGRRGSVAEEQESSLQLAQEDHRRQLEDAGRALKDASR